MNRRAWLVGGMCVLLVAAGAVAYTRDRKDSCGAAVTSLPAARSSSPFLDAKQRAQQPDEDRDTLVETIAEDPAPIGDVVGAVGYHYEQWAHVSAYAQGIGVRTRDNPDFTMLDDELNPRWSVQVKTKRSAYDASDDRYLVATMPRTTAPDLVALDADNGHQRWCAHLGRGAVHADDPFATQFLPDGDVAVLGPGSGGQERVVRFSGKDGHQRWGRTLDLDEGDFLGDLGDGSLLAGGRAQFELLDPPSLAKREEGVGLELLSGKDGHTLWTRLKPAGSDLHVVGADPESRTAVVMEAGPGRAPLRLRAFHGDGTEAWSEVPAPGKVFDATLRAGRVLVRAGEQWSAYDVADGHRLWRRAMPARPQFLPYGFELDSIPLLDGDHALIGGTTALQTLDLRNGVFTSAPLPTDGINTTYWPYELAVSDRLIAIATNTGAVVVRRQ